MAKESHMTPAEVAQEHATESHTPYMTIWAWLAVLTAVEYFYAYIFQELWIVPFLVLLLGLLVLALVKAGLVGWFFMHLKFEGMWVYGLIIPACVLAAILVFALMPDVAYRPLDTEENEEEEAVWVARGSATAFLWPGTDGRCPLGDDSTVANTYRLGILIVAATVLISAAVCWARGSGSAAAPVRAAQELGPAAYPLGDFELVERSGRAVSARELANRVCIASFIFTRCPLSCPRITRIMKDVEDRLGGTNVLLLSLSVNPEHDTPAVLTEYAHRYAASADRWWFLTGPKETIYDLVRERFKLPLLEGGPSESTADREAITHSDRLALLDRGQVVGLFDSSDPQAVDSLIARSRRLALPAWVKFLPTLNASLNAACAALLVVGWFFIRSRARQVSIHPTANPPAKVPARLTDLPPVRRHIVCMVAAITTSTIFLTCYLVYHYQAGSMAFRGSGVVRVVYFSILVSHTLLATLGVVPLVIVTLTRALRNDFSGHRRIAQVTFPIWLYVSVTGVVIYAMLYQMPFAGYSH